MPIYEFACHDCGDDFEALVISFSKVNAVACPECESRNIKKKISAFAVGGDTNGSASWSNNAAACSTSGGT